MKTLRINSYCLYQWTGWAYIVYIPDVKRNRREIQAINDGEHYVDNIEATVVKILSIPSGHVICTYEGDIAHFSHYYLSSCFITQEEALAEYFLEKL